MTPRHTPALAEENFRRLRALFPHAVTESVSAAGEVVRAIDADVLRQEIAAVVEGAREPYRFTWPGKRRALALAFAPCTKTLRPVREKSVGRRGARGGLNSENLYIEGDNLDALKLLRETHGGRIKLIYIDPPYNTGSDFVYKDDFSRREGQGSGERLHSGWLSMMYPRLRLARELLAEDGAILIYIDENEVANLQQLCAEVFGEENALGVIVWDKRNPKGDARAIAQQHEYIVAYARNREALLAARGGLHRPKKNAAAILKRAGQLFRRISKNYTLAAANADFAAWLRAQRDFSAGERAYKYIDEKGDVYRPVSMAWPNKKRPPDEYFQPLLHPATGKPCPVPARGWRNPPATMQKMLREGRILFGKDETTIPNSKYLLRENMEENLPSLLYHGGSDTELLEQLGIPFDTPKPLAICQEHIAAFTSGSDMVLDFFSGSATVAHAVLQQNAEDGGQRRFIMVQWPEPVRTKAARDAGFHTICDMGEARIRRAAQRIRSETGADIDYGVRVLRVESPETR